MLATTYRPNKFYFLSLSLEVFQSNFICTTISPATRAVIHRDFRPISPTPQGLTSKTIDTTRNDALYSTRAEVIGRDIHLLAQKKVTLESPSHA
ncbi:hypothetical protein LR48_Vigan05g016900 [Vigna angularis]|uniref:Uncharacterized protein n=1 Tax=Phaseolus angularis TaxID=3914 RepID=A0A0L9UI52_PHAAN|nr:hypothetical protein LR48_Vigan05g016900 [Vigna angularis]